MLQFIGSQSQTQLSDWTTMSDLMYILFYFFNKLHGVSRVAVSEFSDVIKNSGYLNPSTLSFLVH